MTVEYLEQPYEIFDNPLGMHLLGLQETASGYGSALTSRRCVKLPDGRVRRIYITQFANAGSAWIRLDHRKLFLRDA